MRSKSGATDGPEYEERDHHIADSERLMKEASERGEEKLRKADQNKKTSDKRV